jgi:hypothetical protein
MTGRPLAAWLLPLALACVLAGGVPHAVAQADAEIGTASASAEATAEVTPSDTALYRAMLAIYDEIRDGSNLRINIERGLALLAEQGTPLPESQREPLRAALNAWETAELPAVQAMRLEALEETLVPLLRALEELVPTVIAFDPDNDDGTEINVFWHPQPQASSYIVERLSIRRKVAAFAEPTWETVASAIAPLNTHFTDGKQIAPGDRFRYRVHAVMPDADEPVILGATPVVTARAQWFNGNQLAFLGMVVVVCGSVVFFIERARAGANLKIRQIAGLSAVEDAVGRSVEMGRPILFVPGISEITEVQTVAGLIILGRVGTTAAQYDAHVEVPNRDPLVMTAAREMLQTAYSNAGRPDAYHDEMAYFISGEQFAYVAAVTGTMVREKPAACFYMGSFFAESLILAETGNLIGSIQIAGTANPSQLPFFVAACDYTLIGEEFFAASAYLSGEPHQLGSLKGQDVGKIITLAFMVIGITLATLLSIWHLEDTFVGQALFYIREELLSTTQ